MDRQLRLAADEAEARLPRAKPGPGNPDPPLAVSDETLDRLASTTEDGFVRETVAAVRRRQSGDDAHLRARAGRSTTRRPSRGSTRGSSPSTRRRRVAGSSRGRGDDPARRCGSSVARRAAPRGAGAHRAALRAGAGDELQRRPGREGSGRRWRPRMCWSGKSSRTRTHLRRRSRTYPRRSSADQGIFRRFPARRDCPPDARRVQRAPCGHLGGTRAQTHGRKQGAPAAPSIRLEQEPSNRGSMCGGPMRSMISTFSRPRTMDLPGRSAGRPGRG